MFGRRLEDAKLAWPGVVLDDARFAAYVAERLGARDADLEGAHVGDLYLACACAAGDTQALAHFERAFLLDVPRHVAGIDRSPEFGRAVCQDLRAELFARRPPKILDYRGHGPLGGWVRTAAMRTALSELRSASRRVARERQFESDDAPVDPELQFLKAAYAPIVTEALEATVRALPTDRRNVLRMHYLDDLTIDQIAAVYDVHRSTAARWIAEAREAILDETRRRLREQLQSTPSDIESVLALVRSRLHVSLLRLLRT